MKNSDPPFFHSAPPGIFSNARELRNNMTHAEKLLWHELKGKKLKGFVFRRQHPIGIYIADFYCHKAKLIIELDGEIHDSPEMKEKDAQRDFEIKLKEIRIVRFKNSCVETEISQVLKEIIALLP